MASPPLHLSILLHMHQPWYVDPASGTEGEGTGLYALLPWVRLHGAAGYLDVAAALLRHPGARLTVNLVPSLLLQLQAVVGGARDRYLDVAERPMSDLDLDDRVFLLTRFFSINWSRGVETRPRYRELLDKRGHKVTLDEVRRRAPHFGVEELRDLTVLFHLSWLGSTAREGDETLRQLERKGGGFTSEDLRVVVDKGRAACARVLPLYKELAGRGQVELSCSPCYHPIVPLLCDTDAAAVALPDLVRPARFSHPEDAMAQIRRGQAVFTRTFGKQSAGMWPPEGSISEAALRCYAEAGTAWLVSDEGNLWRSLGAGHMEGAARARALCRPYSHKGVTLFFRDHDLSDRIGFRYAQDDEKAAVSDLLHGVAHAADGGGSDEDEVPVVTLALDGENPWQSYPEHGRPFLDELLGRLAQRPAVGRFVIETVTFAERAKGGQRALSRLHAGSWIDSDFHIWLGDPVKNRAWELLGQARRDFAEAAPGLDERRRERAYELLLIAEGSDWFWWFGEPFHSNEDALYDGLFRGYLGAAYAAMGRTVPPALLDPVDEKAGQGAGQAQAPQAFIHPQIDGRRTSYYEWSGAGVYKVPRGAAMADRPEIVAIHYGFDPEQLYVRVDPVERALFQKVALALELRAGGGRGLRVVISPAPAVGWQIFEPGEPGEAGQAGAWQPRQRGGSSVAEDILEIALPWQVLGITPGQQVQLVVRLLGPDGQARARYPRDGAIEIAAPDSAFAAARWSG